MKLKRLLGTALALFLCAGVLAVPASAEPDIIQLVVDPEGTPDEGIFVSGNIDLTVDPDGKKWSINLKETPDENPRAANPIYQTWVFSREVIESHPYAYLEFGEETNGVAYFQFCWQDGGEAIGPFPFGIEFKTAEKAGQAFVFDLKQMLFDDPIQPKDKTNINVAMGFKYYDDADLEGPMVVNSFYLSSEKPEITTPPPTEAPEESEGGDSTEPDTSKGDSSSPKDESEDGTTQPGEASKPDDKDEGGFPVIPVVVAAVAVVVIGGGVAAYFIVKKKKAGQ